MRFFVLIFCFSLSSTASAELYNLEKAQAHMEEIIDSCANIGSEYPDLSAAPEIEAIVDTYKVIGCLQENIVQISRLYFNDIKKEEKFKKLLVKNTNDHMKIMSLTHMQHQFCDVENNENCANSTSASVAIGSTELYLQSILRDLFFNIYKNPQLHNILYDFE